MTEPSTSEGAQVLAGQIVVVTGGRGGIGSAIVNSVVAAGATSFAIDLISAANDAGNSSPNIHHLTADVSDEASISEAIGMVVANAGRVGALVNCAGVEPLADAPVHELDLAIWERVFRVNVTGTLLASKYALPSMMAAHSGSIINVGSPTGVLGNIAERNTAYTSSKGAVHALTRVMARDYGRWGIRVNTLVPGATKTPLNAALLEDATALDNVIRRTALLRMAEASEIAEAGLFLLSDASRYMTGSLLVVDGGMTAM